MCMYMHVHTDTKYYFANSWFYTRLYCKRSKPEQKFVRLTNQSVPGKICTYFARNRRICQSNLLPRTITVTFSKIKVRRLIGPELRYDIRICMKGIKTAYQCISFMERWREFKTRNTSKVYQYAHILSRCHAGIFRPYGSFKAQSNRKEIFIIAPHVIVNKILRRQNKS